MHVLNVLTPLGRKFFQKSNNNFKIIGVRRVTGSKVHKRDQKILRSTVQNLVTTAVLTCIIKPTRCTKFSNLFLEQNSTCFGQFLCPSSGVFHCTHSNCICHTGLLCVQWKTPDDGQRNCPKHVEFYSKNKFEKLVHLVGFIIRFYHDARSPERQITAANRRPKFKHVCGTRSSGASFDKKKNFFWKPKKKKHKLNRILSG